MASNLPQLRHQIAWDGKMLVVTNPETLAAIRRPALSASTSKSMQSCAARWVGERLLRKEKEDPFDPAPIGTAAHSVMEDFFELDGAERTMARAHAILEAKADLEWVGDPEADSEVRGQTAINRMRWVRDVKNAYQGIFVSETPALIDVYGRELAIENLELAGVPVIGYIDRVSRIIKDGASGLQPEDFKTGKMPEKSKLARFGDDHGDQLRIYAAALEVMFDEKPLGAKVIYTKFGKERDVNISNHETDKTLKVFSDSWGRHNRYMDAAAFPTKTGALCGWCPLVNSCHVAKEAGYAASPKMVDKLPTVTALAIPSLRPGITPWPVHTTTDMTVPNPGNSVTYFQPEPDLQINVEEVPETVSAETDAAHITDSGDSPKDFEEQDKNMASQQGHKPWDTIVDGELYPASYVAGAVFGLTTMAVENLSTAGLPIKGVTVKALAATYLHVVTEAQASWTGSTELEDAGNIRLRAALYTVLRTLPQPWGKDAEEWDAWVIAAIKRCQAITTVALYLYDGDLPETPWHGIADIVPVKPEAEVVKAKAPRARATKVAAPKVSPAPKPVVEPVVEPEPIPAPVVVEPVAVVLDDPETAKAAKPSVNDGFDFPSDDDVAGLSETTSNSEFDF